MSPHEIATKLHSSIVQDDEQRLDMGSRYFSRGRPANHKIGRQIGYNFDPQPDRLFPPPSEEGEILSPKSYHPPKDSWFLPRLGPPHCTGIVESRHWSQENKNGPSQETLHPLPRKRGRGSTPVLEFMSLQLLWRPHGQIDAVGPQRVHQ